MNNGVAAYVAQIPILVLNKAMFYQVFFTELWCNTVIYLFSVLFLFLGLSFDVHVQYAVSILLLLYGF